MTLNRIVLRMAAICALSNFGRSSDFPTLAGEKVYDSRIDPKEAFEGQEPFPICVLYTDYDRNFVKHASIAGAERLLTITIETLIVQREEEFSEPDEEGNQFSLGWALGYPATDSEMEFDLDLFEGQVFAALNADNSAANCFKSLMPRIKDVISRRGASMEGGQRLAARQTTIEGDLLRDPVVGNLPPYIDDFLTELVEHPDLGGRAAGLRARYLAEGTTLSDDQKLIRTMGYPRRAVGGMGYSPDAPVLRRAPVRYLNPDGSAFLE